MAKVYVVTSGYYSSYRIQGIFSDRKKAKAWSKLMSGTGYGDQYKIETWELDQIDDISLIKAGERNFMVYMWDSGGSHLEPGTIHVSATDKDRCPVQHDPTGNNAHWTAVVLAKDIDHARKIASDMFAEARASGLGLT